MVTTFLAALVLQAATAQPSCPATPVAPPAPLAGWRDAHPLAHGFVVGRAVDLPAMTATTVRLSVQPSKPLSGTYLATGGFEVKTAGRYAVAAGGARSPLRPLWLDIAGTDGKPLTSVSHGHGPRCSSITKVVDYDLRPGQYTFLATGLTGADPVRVLVVRRR